MQVRQSGFHLLARSVVPVVAGGSCSTSAGPPAPAGGPAAPDRPLACLWLLDERGVTNIGLLVNFFLNGLRRLYGIAPPS